MICHINREKLKYFKRKRRVEVMSTNDFLKAGGQFMAIFKELRNKYPETPSRILVMAAINKMEGFTQDN